MKFKHALLIIGLFSTGLLFTIPHFLPNTWVGFLVSALIGVTAIFGVCGYILIDGYKSEG